MINGFDDEPKVVLGFPPVISFNSQRYEFNQDAYNHVVSLNRCCRDACFSEFIVSPHMPRDACFPAHISLTH